MTSSEQGIVTLFFWREMKVGDYNAVKIVEFYGGTIRCVDLNSLQSPTSFTLHNLVRPGGCVIVQVNAIAAARSQENAGQWSQLLNSLEAKILLFGFDAIPAHRELLSEITSGDLVSVELADSKSGQFAVNGDDPCAGRHFSGLKIGTANPAYDRAFVVKVGSNSYTSLIHSGQSPFLVHLRKHAAELMLLACCQIADLDGPVPNASSLVDFFSRLVPLLMFLFHCFGDRLWRNQDPRACIVLDDPLLRPRYGFLDYESLLSEMLKRRFCTSIAFIPWNYRRSSTRVAKLFESHPDRFSLSVHGCDHTSREFGSDNYDDLRARAQKALNRMQIHERLTHVGFDDVMVFPQGIFSSTAMRALKSCGYLAAVNSSPYPTDALAESLKLRDLVDVAVLNFSNFPLFRRRYPSDLPGLAFDIFLGKQALLVEHHDYFRDGNNDLVKIVDRLNSMDSRLQWSNLSTLCTRACLTREIENGEVEVKFYTDRFFLQNTTTQTRRHVLQRSNTIDDPPLAVTINGIETDCEVRPDGLRFLVSLDPGQSAAIVVQRATLDKPITREHLQATVLFRRILSEFRDDYISKNRTLSRLSSRVRHHLLGNK